MLSSRSRAQALYFHRIGALALCDLGDWIPEYWGAGRNEPQQHVLRIVAPPFPNPWHSVEILPLPWAKGASRGARSHSTVVASCSQCCITAYSSFSPVLCESSFSCSQGFPSTDTFPGVTLNISQHLAPRSWNNLFSAWLIGVLLITLAATTWPSIQGWQSWK